MRSGEASLAHVDEKGQADVTDVSGKKLLPRVGRAEGFITMPAELIDRITSVKGGNIYEIARLAGIMGTKKTPDIIPLCYALNLDNASLEFTQERENGRVRAFAEVRCHTRAGVEMEALTAVSAALLTLYLIGMGVAREESIKITDVAIVRDAGDEK